MEYRTFNITECVSKPLKKCFDYEQTICTGRPKTETVSIDYKDQKLIELADVSEEHCIQQTTYDCSTRQIVEYLPQQVRKQRPVTDTQRRCNMVPRKTPDQEVTIPVTRVIYKTMCYNVPRSTCTQAACSGNTGGVCPPSSRLCSGTEFTTGTVCPEPMGGSGSWGGSSIVGGSGSWSGGSGLGVGSGIQARGGCQQVQNPVCGNQNMCQSANQQCCVTQNQQVCRQVPQRVVEQVKQVMPGQTSWQEECKDFPVERMEWYVETINNTVTRNRQDCKPIVTPKCHTFLKPTYDLVEEDKSSDVSLQLTDCELSRTSGQHCHVFPNADAECKESSVRKAFRVNRKVCDQQQTQQVCVNLPVMDCRLGTTANCKMVPRQVCQDECSDSPMCNKCDEFRNGQGFGSCKTSTCGNFYPNDPTFNPGTGGSGFYPGGVGGEGMYPGGIGGEGMYPGDGGQGFFPGGEGVTEVDGFTRPPYWNGGSDLGGERPPYFSEDSDDQIGGRPGYWTGAGGSRPPYPGFNVAPAVPNLQ